MTEEERKAAFNYGKSIAEFREANDERLRQRETKGSADPLLEAKVDRIGAEVARMGDRMSRQEAAGKRPAFGALDTADEVKACAAFAKERGAEMDLEAYKNYKSAFSNYIRKNNAGNQVEEQKALSVGSDADGGFAVSPDMSGQIVKLISETSPMRSVANVTVIGSDALEGVRDLNEATSGWVGETEDRAETTAPKLGEWRIPVYEQYAEPRATQKLLDDAMFNVEEYLGQKIADRFSRMENAAFINGNGVKKPRGILTYAAGTPSASNFNVIEQVLSGASAGFDEDDGADALLNLIYSLKADYRAGASFMMKRSTLAAIRKLKDGSGNYIWQPGDDATQKGTIFGFNVVEAEDMPELSAGSLSIAFGDFKSAYQIVDRQGIRILRDSFTAKPYVKFYTTKRVGGDVVNFEALKLMKFATS